MSSSILVGVGLAASAALVQTLIHASLKATGDQIALRALIGIVSVAVCLPLALYAGVPGADTWRWLAASTVVHLLFKITIIQAYRRSDFSAAYPVMRGLVPIVSVGSGWLVLGESITITSAAGVLLSGAALAYLSFRDARSAHGWAPAVIAGGLAAAYSVIDAAGVRSSPDPLVFIAWFFVLEGVTMVAVAILWHRHRLARQLRIQWRTGVICGAATLISYSASLISFKLLPLSASSALHLSSVIFSVVVARVVLAEPVSRSRWAAATLVFAGAVLVVAGLGR